MNRFILPLLITKALFINGKQFILNRIILAGGQGSRIFEGVKFWGGRKVDFFSDPEG